MLARLLPREDFGLVGAVLIFQAFASLFVDSGFSYALIQRKRPSRLDYSTVLWFNLAVSAVVYLLLYICAPLIADCFHGDQRLIPLSRVLLLSLILNASAIVQTNRLVKAMAVRPVAVANAIGLTAGAVVGITLAVGGFGAWAIVWQTLATGAVKSLVLWTSSSWRPLMRFSFAALRSYFGVGSRMMFTSFLNTVFLQINSFFIGNRVGVLALAYYTQSDKWSKMGITAISQTLTSSFLPALSAVQDDKPRFSAMVSKMNRFTAYVLFPAMGFLMLMAAPVFHTLFGLKWDASIILFQMLLLRGVFIVLNGLYTNYLLALGHSGTIVRLEIIRDVTAVAALIVTMPVMALSTADDPVYGITIMLWGQIAATVVTFIVTLATLLRTCGLKLGRFVSDNAPYIAQTGLIMPVMFMVSEFFDPAPLKLVAEALVALTLYVGGNYFLRSRIQSEVFAFFKGKKIT